MGIFQRFKDEVPAIFVATFVGLLTAVVAFLAVSFVGAYAFSRLPQFIRLAIVLIVTFAAAGATTAVALGKLQRKP
jgi:ABC-type Co2+ transport system permease subunit